MDNPNPIKYSDLIQPDNSITDLISQLNSLVGAYETAKGKIQAAASETAKSLQGVSGASEEQRKTILQSTEASEKLLAEYKKLDSELMQAKIAQAEANAANREYNQIAKLMVEINQSREGSYKRLSAQYRLNKIALNEMTEAERKGTEYGRKLEAESKAIYERMNELQKATGKAQLQVGQYERALGGLVGVSPRVISALTDTKGAMNALTGVFNVIKGPIGAVIGLIGGLTAAFKLFKTSIHETQVTGDEFDREMAGWTATWDVFKKAVSAVDFSIFINNARDAARAGRELRDVLDEAFERANSTAILRAKLGPQLQEWEEIFRDQGQTLETRISAADKYLDKVKEIYGQEIESARRVRDAQLGTLFDETKARKNLTDTEREAGKQRLADFIANYNYNETLIEQTKEYNKALDVQAKVEKGFIVTPQEVAAAQKVITSATEDVKEYSAIVRQYGLTNDKQVKAYVDSELKLLGAEVALYNENKRMITQKANLQAQYNKKREDDAKAAAKAAQDAADAQVKADRAAAEEAKKKADEEARAAQQEIANQRAVLNASLQSIQLQIAVTEEGTQEMLQLRLDMINKQREIEIFENKQKVEQLRQDEKAINAKYDTLVLREAAKFNTQLAQRNLAALQDRAKEEFDILDRNERQKTLYRLQMEEQRLLAVLEINKTAVEKMTKDEVSAVMSAIANIQKQRSTLGYNNLYELFGIKLDSNQQDALNTAIGSVKDTLASIVDSWNEVAEAAIRAADAQVDSAQRALDAEIEARNAGYANSVETAKKELEQAKKTQAEALRERERAQKTQIALDAAQQSSSLITATANIWKALSGISPFGTALAIAAIATMWGSFAASKVKAVQAVKSEQYGEGTVELLQGGSHASGHDIDLGRKPNGTRRRAEGGEFFAVINKRNSRKYRSVIPDVINSFNNGTFADRYQRANAAMAGAAFEIAGGTDITSLERDVAAIRRQGDETRSIDGKGNTIIRYKNLTRKIYKN